MASDKGDQVEPMNFLSYVWNIDSFTKRMTTGEEFQLQYLNKISIASKGTTQDALGLMVYPNGRNVNDKGFVSLFVTLDRHSNYDGRNKNFSGTNVKNFSGTNVTCSILNKDGNKTRARSQENTSGGGRLSVEWEKFISHNSLLLFQHDLLHDDCLSILCEINIAGGPDKSFKGALESNVIVKAESLALTRLSSNMLSMINGKFTDFEVICEGKKFLCHKSVLGSRSTVFDAMFSHNMEEKNKSTVEILDLNADTVTDMLSYIYSGQVDKLKDKASGLLIAADKYDLKELKEMCEASLTENIDEDNALDLLVLADLHGARSMRDIAVKFIVYNGEKIIIQPDWSDKLKGHPEIMADIIKSFVSVKI